MFGINSKKRYPIGSTNEVKPEPLLSCLREKCPDFSVKLGSCQGTEVGVVGDERQMGPDIDLPEDVLARFIVEIMPWIRCTRSGVTTYYPHMHREEPAEYSHYVKELLRLASDGNYRVEALED